MTYGLSNSDSWLLGNFRGTSRNLADTRQMAPTVDNIACFAERIVELLTGHHRAITSYLVPIKNKKAVLSQR